MKERSHMKNLAIALAFQMTFSLPVMAQDFDKGVDADLPPERSLTLM